MKQGFSDPRPKSIQSVDISFKKDDKKIQELDLPVEEIDIDKLLWHFDYPFWEKEGTNDWNLTAWELIKNPEGEPTHYKRVRDVNLLFPLQIMWYKNRWLLLDGLHRLVKAYVQGKKKVKVRIVPESAISQIKTGMWNEKNPTSGVGY